MFHMKYLKIVAVFILVNIFIITNYLPAEAANVDSILQLVRLRNDIEDAKKKNSTDGVALSALAELSNVIENLGKSISEAEKLKDQIEANNIVLGNVLNKIENLNSQSISPLSNYYKTAQKNVVSISKNINKLKNVKALGKLIKKIGSIGGGAVTAVSYKNELEQYKRDVQAGKANFVTHATIIKNGLRSVTETYVPGSSKAFTLLDDVLIGMVVVPSSDWVGDIISDRKVVASNKITNLLSESNQRLRTKIRDAALYKKNITQLEIKEIVRETNGELFRSLSENQQFIDDSWATESERNTFENIKKRAFQEMLNPSQRREEAAYILYKKFTEVIATTNSLPLKLLNTLETTNVSISRLEAELSSADIASYYNDNADYDLSEVGSIDDFVFTNPFPNQSDVPVEYIAVNPNVDLSDENLVEFSDTREPEASTIIPDVTPIPETNEPTDDEGSSVFDRLTTNRLQVGVLNSDSRGNNGDQIELQPRLGGGTVQRVETFNVSEFAYTTLGRWSAVAGTPSSFSQGGFFATIDGTPTTAVQSLSGSATYNGNIIGEFVSNEGNRDDARGRIEIGVDFSNQSVTGQFQLGHNCSSISGGPSGCNTVSRVADFSEPINDYLTSDGAGFGNHSDEFQTSGSSVVGIFGGPNGEEIGGDVFLSDNGGNYNGVFQAGRSSADTDVIIPTNQESEQLTGYVTGGDFSLTNNGQSFVVGTQDSQINGSINDESVTLNFEDDIVNGNSQTVLTTNRTESDYNYLTWGLTNQLLSRASRSEQFTHTLENSFWLVGQQTPENILAERMGTATFLGDINGHLIDASDGTDLDDLEETAGNFYNTVTGNVMFSADFSSNSITGAGTFLINTPFDDNVQEDFRIIGDLSDTTDGPSRTVLPSNPNANFSAASSVNTVSRLSGNSGEGYLLGSFFGPQAQEFGGAFGYFANDGGGAITGVVTAREGGDPIEEQNGDGPILGFIAAKEEGRQSLITNNLYTGLEDGGDAELGSRGEARLVRDSVNTLYSDGINPSIEVTLNAETRGNFSYTDWGEWNGQGRTLAQLAGASVDGNGLFVIGTSTRADQLPRTGTASYSGEAEAIGFSGERLNGDVEFNANFGNNTIEGDINLNRANGDAWISANTGNLNIQSRTSVVEYNGQSSNVRGANGEQFAGATLFIGGRFYGPNAEEIAGDFVVSGVPDEVGGVDGVYRAQQSVSTGRPSDGGGPFRDRPRDIINTTSRTNF